MLLKAAKAKYKYKNENAWLDAVYRKNKTFIDSKLSVVGEKNKKKVFKQLVKERQDRGETTYRAVKNLGKTEIFTSRRERSQENILKAIKSDKETFKQFRKEIGFNTKIDTTKFEWDYKDKVYKYGNTIIDITNSPYKIKIYEA